MRLAALIERSSFKVDDKRSLKSTVQGKTQSMLIRLGVRGWSR
jgi:hypothetical protein